MADEITDAEIDELRRFAAHPAGYHMSKEVLAGLLARLERAERERDEAIENARVASHDRRELMELTSAKKYGFGRGEALEARIATLEAQRDEYAEQYGVMGVALTVAERKLSAYVGVCAGDKELTESVLPKVRAALRGVEGKP